MARSSIPNSGVPSGAEASSDFLPSLLPSLVSALPGPLLVVDPDERVVLASPAASELLGCSPEKLIGQPAAHLFPDGLDGADLRGVRMCGSKLRIDISRRQMKHEGRDLTLLWLHDVTERHRSEESLLRHVEDLQQATQAKSELVASMSHEIRTPMNAVLGMTDILLDSDLDDTQRELAERVRRAGANLLTTLNDVLDLAKVEAGQLDLTANTFAVRPWLHEAMELFHAQAESKGITLRASIDCQVPESVQGDAPRLRQVVVNLVGNAVKFTSEGGVEVRVALNRAGDSLCFRIRDTGVGIDPAHLDRLFEPWAQGGSATAHDYGGTGLGLAIARKLVLRMGGSIEADSEPGRGSEFRFRVPLAPKKSTHREPVALSTAPRPTPRADSQRLA